MTLVPTKGVSSGEHEEGTLHSLAISSKYPALETRTSVHNLNRISPVSSSLQLKSALTNVSVLQGMGLVLASQTIAQEGKY